jgi:hypothetical protein
VLTTYLGAAGAILALFMFSRVWAQSDAYWQQMTANRAAQCDTQIVQLLRTLDEQKKQIEDMTKQLEELKTKK